MPRESITDKAKRYLSEGYVTVSRVEADQVDATVQGTKVRPYIVSYRTERGWRCSCVAPGARCTHTIAVSMLVLVPEPTTAVTK